MPLVPDDFKAKDAYKKALAKNIGPVKNGKFLYLKVKFEDKKAGEVLVFGQFYDVLKTHFEEQKATVLDKGTITGGVFQPTKGYLTAKGIQDAFGVEVAVAGEGENKSDDGTKGKSSVVLETKEEKDKGLDKNQKLPVPGLENLTVGNFLKLVTEMKTEIARVKFPKVKQKLNGDLDDLVERLQKQDFSNFRKDYDEVRADFRMALEHLKLEAELIELEGACKRSHDPEHLKTWQQAVDYCKKGKVDEAGNLKGKLEMDLRLEGYTRSSEDAKIYDDFVAQRGGLAKSYESFKTTILKQAAKLEDKEEKKRIAEFVRKTLKHGLKTHLEKIDKEGPGPKRDGKIDETIQVVQTYIDDTTNAGLTWVVVKPYVDFLKFLRSELKKEQQGTPT